jgi:FMN phosphatase YigB (HAD superfamily)
MTNKIENYKNMIFDLGGVLLNLDFNQTLKTFKKRIPHLNEDFFLGKEKQLDFYSDYETGKVTTSAFIDSFRNFYQISISDSEFEDCWNAMIFDFPLERILLLKKLRHLDKRIYLLSNINELHETAVQKSFAQLGLGVDFSSLFDRVYYSHRVGLRKPDTDIFNLVINDNDLNVSETVFIDDSLQHVLSARKCGLDAIYLERPATIEGLPLFSK